jgi:hypothetical protein
MGWWGPNGFASGCEVVGNDIGTDVTGTRSLSDLIGVYLSQCPGVTIGGTAPGAGNVISATYGLRIGDFNSYDGTGGNTIAGNFIGTDPTGTANFGGERGVEVLTRNNTLTGNVIAYNRTAVEVAAGVGNLIRSNSVYADLSYY